MHAINTSSLVDVDQKAHTLTSGRDSPHTDATATKTEPTPTALSTLATPIPLNKRASEKLFLHDTIPLGKTGHQRLRP
jgi:hypothetical protein